MMKLTSVPLLFLVSCSLFGESASGKSEAIDRKFISDYFSIVSGDFEGGEFSLSMSEKFTERFSKHCKITVHINAFNDASPWVQGVGASFVLLTPSSLLDQSFYVGGLGKTMTIGLKYFSDCFPEEKHVRFEK